MSTYQLPDGTTVTAEQLRFGRSILEAEAALTADTRAKFASEHADAVDEEGLLLHARAEARIGKPVYTEAEYAAAVEEEQRHGVAVRRVADEDDEADQLTAYLVRGEALDRIATARGPAKSEAEYLERLDEAQRSAGIRYDGRAV